MVFMTLLAISILVISPTVTKIMQREHEEELIFRGRQYAQALVNFQKRQGRFPLKLSELMKTQPRSARKLYKEPMCNCSDWGLIRVGQPWPPPKGGTNPAGGAGSTTSSGSPFGGFSSMGTSGSGSGRTQPVAPVPDTYTIPPAGPGGSGTVPDDSDSGSGDSMQFGGGSNKEVSNVPIIGVYSKVHKKGLRTFHGQEYYDQWGFIAGANNDPDLPANILPGTGSPYDPGKPKPTKKPGGPPKTTGTGGTGIGGTGAGRGRTGG